MSKLQIETSGLSMDMTFASEYTPGKGNNAKSLNSLHKVPHDLKKGDFSSYGTRKLSVPRHNIKRKADANRNALGNSNKSSIAEGKISFRDRLHAPAYGGRGFKPAHAGPEDRVLGGHVKPRNLISKPKRFTLDDDAKKR